MKMKQSFTILIAIILSVALISCSKENDSATFGVDITGNYKYISLQAKTNSTVQSVSGSDMNKTVTTSEYTTQNNTGTITIDAGKFTSSNLAYSVNATANSTLYENGVVSGTYSMPFQFTLPSSNGTATYRRISADSIYFESGSILIGGSANASLPGGAKIKIENGNLTLYTTTVQSSTTSNQGETVTSVANVVSVITLQKQ